MNVHISSLIGAALTATLSFTTGADDSDPSVSCHVGLYELNDGRAVDIGPSDEDSLRWRLPAGDTGKLSKDNGGVWRSTYGWTDRPDGVDVQFGSCAENTISFAGTAGRRVAFDVTDVTFASGETKLAGRLVMPKGDGPVPIVVLVHGSERMSAREYYYDQRRFPAEGIGVFVYDKRGTGGSEGDYTQDYSMLAQDAAAAFEEARKLAGERTSRIGFQGGSQGGWVAPLAATMVPADYIVVSFGLAVSPLEEDRSSILLDMVRAGYGAGEIDKAMKVADAVAAVVEQGFTGGYDKLESVKQRYSGEEWFKHVRGNITWFMLATPEDKLREIGPKLLPGIKPHYDPMPVLESLDIPQLWILGGEDREAPSPATTRILRGLAAEGKPIITAVFPTADHGIYEFELTPEDERISTRHSEGYFQIMRDYLLTGDIGEHYGTGRIYRSN